MTRLVVMALILAAAGFAWSLERAIRLDPMPMSKPHGAMVDTAGEHDADADLRGSPRSAMPPMTRLAAAVDHDPFRPERQRPALRFRLPGEPLPTGDTAPEPTATPPFKLIGTAVMAAGRGFAMCQWGNQSPKLVRIGERVGELTLREVAPGRAVFVTVEGQRMEVTVPKAGAGT